jgi:rhodanese-related sulfurtransferase
LSDLWRETSLAAGPRLDPSKIKFPELTWTEVKSLLSSNKIVLVDARPADLYQAGRIPGAVSLALPDLNTSITNFESTYCKNTALVVYCSSPECVQAEWEAEALLGAHGYNNVQLMPGGYEEYTRTEANTGASQK